MANQGEILEKSGLLKLIIDEVYYSIENLKDSSAFMDYWVT
jgi:hypothetical protein